MSELSVRAVVINVVYDGPPRAGKTTSVRSLARSLGRDVYTPEERDGRTVYFDWLEHMGGRFEGAPIHCQIASVPGQRRWTRRRGYFLERADVIVFVGDTTARGWPDTVGRLRALRDELDARPGIPVGLVFQANKRDCADAVAIDEVRAGAAHARTAIVETSAELGTGVREAFVFAVRLALDRVREELDRGGSPPERWLATPAGPELVAQLRELEPVEHPRAAPERTPPPAPDVPSGFVWPPIEGRILLREIALTPNDEVWQTPEGDRVAARRGWRVHSRGPEQFSDLDAARAALLAWAREHAAALPLVSRRRCIVLSAVGEQWRLWQIVERQLSLGELVERTAISAGDAARALADVQQAAHTAGLRLPCTLDTVGLADARPVFVGLMPRAVRGEAA